MNRDRFIKLTLYLSIISFIANILTHIGTYYGITKPFGLHPEVIMLFSLVVVFCFGTYCDLILSDYYTNKKDRWKAILRVVPLWLKISLVAMFIYSFYISFQTNVPVYSRYSTRPDLLDVRILKYFSVSGMFFSLASIIFTNATIKLLDKNNSS